MKIKIFFIIFTVFILITTTAVSCSRSLNEKTEPANKAITTIDTIGTLAGHKNEPLFKPEGKLLFVLQCAGFNELSEAEFDVAVIDCDDSCLTEKEIRKLREQGKSIISYLSIGEAENYRYYWQKGWRPGNPDFIDAENPDWPGNYKVKFWSVQWQEIIFSKLDEIVRLGYDGVYLDVVDAYKYFKNKENNDNYSVNAKLEMVEFVKAISARAKTINPKFLIIPQNAEELVLENGYLDAIDGLGRESLWFENNIRIENEIMSEVLENISYTKNSGKFIFAISYIDDKVLAAEFLRLCSIHGFIPYIGPVELNLVE